MKLYTFGDSHSRCLSWQTVKIELLEIKLYQGTPSTMSRFAGEKLEFLNIKDFGVEENDAVCFCFGEIDCRMHFSKQVNFKNHELLIDELVKRYFEAISKNVEQYKNLITMVFNISPPCRNFNDAIFIGTDEERKKIYLYMNYKLKEYCQLYNYIFLDVYDKYCDDDGFLKLLFKDTAVHINNGIYIEEFLKQQFL